MGLISPALALVVLLCLIYAGLFHLWRGRAWLDLGVSILSALLGFAVGQAIGYFVGLNLLVVGQIYVLEGTLMSWLAMLAVAWLRG